ncbi:MAG: nitroreductase [Cyclobacteriaceae bacterium]|nr:MAG: nitroreductase [Cyclobacteriaceae bacterium]
MQAQSEILKSTEIEYTLLPELEKRRSKRAFSDKAVSDKTIRSLFEAARWAPSSMNSQPWVYVYATKDQPEFYESIVNTLNEGNKIWAQQAPVLVVSFARKNHLANGAINGAARYDVGAANALLSVQATHAGLSVRQMGGYNKSLLINALNVPDELDPIVVLAIGYPGDPESLPENLKAREHAPRERYVQQFFVRSESF